MKLKVFKDDEYRYRAYPSHDPDDYCFATADEYAFITHASRIGALSQRVLADIASRRVFVPAPAGYSPFSDILNAPDLQACKESAERFATVYALEKAH